MNHKKIITMRRTDAAMTAELRQRDGVLGAELQERYGVVRDGEEIWVRREELAIPEREIIIAELRRRGQEAMGEAQAIARAQETAR